MCAISFRFAVYLTCAGITHGDIKPQHTLGDCRYVHLVNLGNARDTADGRLLGVGGGTASYMAPELTKQLWGHVGCSVTS